MANSSSTDQGTSRSATSGRWLGLMVLSFPTMLIFLDLTVMFLALPHMSVALEASALQSLWMVDIYGFMIAGTLITMGRLGDRIGRRRLILLGASAFGLLSLAAAFSSSAEMVILARAGMGVAGATIMPCTLALIKTMFPEPKEMAKAMGIWTAMGMAGLCLGPPVGGLLLTQFWWGSVFLLAIPVVALLLIAGPVLLTESRDENAAPLDLLSVLLSLLAILGVVFGLKEMARNGWETWPAIALVAGLISGVVFVRRQRNLDDPLLDVSLLKLPTVAGALLVFLVTGIVQSGSGLLVAQELQLVDRLTPLAAALWLILPSIVAIVGVQVSIPLATRMRPSWVLMGGLAVSAAGMVVLSRVGPTGGVALLITGLCISYAGVSAVPAISNQLTMAAAPPERSGSAGSLSTTSGELGNALGIAVMGSLAAVVYSSWIVLPTGLSDGEATAARESLAEAASVADGLPASQGAQVLATAQEAFTDAFGVVALSCAVILLLLAGVVFLTMRHIAPIGSEEPTDESEEADGADSESNERQPVFSKRDV